MLLERHVPATMRHAIGAQKPPPPMAAFALALFTLFDYGNRARTHSFTIHSMVIVTIARGVIALIKNNYSPLQSRAVDFAGYLEGKRRRAAVTKQALKGAGQRGKEGGGDLASASAHSLNWLSPGMRQSMPGSRSGHVFIMKAVVRARAACGADNSDDAN